MITSIDYPVDTLVIINNGSDAGVTGIIEHVRQYQPKHVGKIEVHLPGRNLGVAASWNWTMMRYPGARYWVFVGNDIEFSTGDLHLMASGCERHPEYVIRPANWGHSFFAVLPPCIEQVGYFDENFYPAYCEDQDQMYRIKLAGSPWADIGKAPDESVQCSAVHGEAPSWGSSTIYADPALFKKNDVTHRRNFDYYCRKWGGPPKEEQFSHPFGREDWPIQYWEIDIELREANEAIFASMKS